MNCFVNTSRLLLSLWLPGAVKYSAKKRCLNVTGCKLFQDRQWRSARTPSEWERWSCRGKCLQRELSRATCASQCSSPRLHFLHHSQSVVASPSLSTTRSSTDILWLFKLCLRCPSSALWGLFRHWRASIIVSSAARTHCTHTLCAHLPSLRGASLQAASTLLPRLSTAALEPQHIWNTFCISGLLRAACPWSFSTHCRLWPHCLLWHLTLIVCLALSVKTIAMLFWDSPPSLRPSFALEQTSALGPLTLTFQLVSSELSLFCFYNCPSSFSLWTTTHSSERSASFDMLQFTPPFAKFSQVKSSVWKTENRGLLWQIQLSSYLGRC